MVRATRPVNADIAGNSRVLCQVTPIGHTATTYVNESTFKLRPLVSNGLEQELPNYKQGIMVL